ncbi:MAG: hypothetical protein QM791_22945 [Ferruginibacter sp.]
MSSVVILIFKYQQTARELQACFVKMAFMGYKWLFFFLMSFQASKPAPVSNIHPFFVSVTQIEHNAKEQTLEVSCKIFTDDFEKTLRLHYKDKIDLLDEKMKNVMNPLVSGYILQHFSIKADDKPVQLKFIGFEQQEEGIVSYFEAGNVLSPKKITVFNNLLYEYQETQTGIIHVTVNGKRQSTKLENPASTGEFSF